MNGASVAGTDADPLARLACIGAVGEKTGDVYAAQRSDNSVSHDQGFDGTIQAGELTGEGRAKYLRKL